MIQIAVKNKRRFTCEFRNSDGELADPTDVTVRVTDEAGTETEYEYGTDDEVERASEGVYFTDVTFDTVGDWQIKFWGEGDIVASHEEFLIKVVE